MKIKKRSKSRKQQKKPRKSFFKKRLSLEKDTVELKGKSRISSILQKI
jgi:hypothetical protein